MTRTIKYIFTLIVLSIALCGCNQEDDVFEIFANDKTWHWSGSYTTTNWKDDNNYKLNLNIDDLSQINKRTDYYNIIFEENGNVSGKGENFTFKGTWNAMSKDKSFYINIQTQGNISGLDKTFYDAIKSANFYRGDSKCIKLFNSNKSEYIQFYPLGSLNQ